MAKERQISTEEQKLLRALGNKKITKIKPLIDGERVTYPDVQELTGLDSGATEEFLQYLVSEDILLKEPSDCLFACPNCGSIRMLYKLRCPACQSTALKAGGALEHLHCGYLDMEDVFSKSGFQCPKCRKELKTLGVDYRKVGTYYRCISCTEIHSAADAFFYCMNCTKTPKFDDAKMSVFYSYSLNPETREKIAKYSIDLSLISEKLKTHGFETKFDSTVKGKSGLEHEVGIIVYDKKKKDGEANPDIIADIVISSNEVDESSVLSFMAKIIDIDIESHKCILAVVPKLSERARKLALFYGRRVVEHESVADLGKRLPEEIEGIAKGVT